MSLGFPLLADVKLLLQQEGELYAPLSDTNNDALLTQALASAQVAWQTATGRTPYYIPEGVDSTRFNPTYDVALPLGQGYSSITSVTEWITYGLDGSSNNDGKLLVEDYDYVREPLNDTPTTILYRRIGTWSGGARSIQIIGKRGMADLDQRAFDAVRMKACALARPHCAQAPKWEKAFMLTANSSPYKLFSF